MSSPVASKYMWLT